MYNSTQSTTTMERTCKTKPSLTYTLNHTEPLTSLSITLKQVTEPHDQEVVQCFLDVKQFVETLLQLSIQPSSHLNTWRGEAMELSRGGQTYIIHQPANHPLVIPNNLQPNSLYPSFPELLALVQLSLMH